MGGVEPLHPAADEIEGALEVPEVLDRSGDLRRPAVDQLVRFFGLPELLLADLRTQRGSGLVPPVLDRVRPLVGTDLLQPGAERIGALVDPRADDFLALVDQIAGPVVKVPAELPPVHHQLPCPHRGCSA